MKKKVYFLTALCASLLLQSCKKESIQPTTTEVSSENTSPNANNLAFLVNTPLTVSVKNGIYHFSSEAQLKAYLTNIENQDKLFQQNFLAQYGGLSNDELNAVIEELNWNANQLLDQIEASKGVVSLRSTIQQSVDEWLNNGIDLDLENPDRHIITDRYLRSVINASGNLVVGSKIYVFSETGRILKIDGLDYDLMNQINTGAITKELAPNNVLDITNGDEVIWRIAALGADDCKANKSSGWIMTPFSSNRRIYGRVSINNVLNVHNTKAETQSYKKNSNNKWKKYHTAVRATVSTADSKIRNTSCDKIDHPGKFVNDNNWQVDAKAPAIPNQQIRCYKSEVLGTFYADGYQFSYSLTW